MNNQFSSGKRSYIQEELERKRGIWNKISRIAAFFVSIAIWWVSINFSVDGFKFQQPGMEWIGWVLGLSVTVIEVVFNKPGVRRNVTLWVIGMMAYAYGMWTNVVGIHLAGNGHGGWIWAGLLGAVLEWIPEVLFVWSILGVVTKEGDFIGNVIKMFTGGKDDDDDDGGYDKPTYQPKPSSGNFPKQHNKSQNQHRPIVPFPSGNYPMRPKPTDGRR